MLRFEQMLFKYGDRILFEDTSAVVHSGHKVGLVGRNGSGKTTLFDLVRGIRVTEEGDVIYPKNWQIAWLEQQVKPSSRTALEFVIDGNVALRKVESKMHRAELHGDNDALAELQAEFERLDGYIAESRAGSILSGLGFTKGDFEKPHRAFSGGWRIRLNLAQTLMAPADLMLLDEPTNHLDLEAIVWLQKWIKRFDGTLVCISHDREFLDQTVEDILHIEQTRIFMYRGNYSSFERQRAQHLAHQSTRFVKQEAERARIQKFVDRFRAKASKARQVQSRVKLLDRMVEVAPVRAESPYHFKIGNPSRQTVPTIALDKVTLGYSEEIVVDAITQRIYPRDRIGVLGLNGAGKSTLLKALAGEITAMQGEITFGGHVSVGYFAQHQLEQLDGTKSPIDHLADIAPLTEQTARTYLGGWGFSGDDVFRPVSEFSGGEKARLVLALLARQNPSVLLLDEPTNHLDIEMRDALATALNEYEGAVVLVAHDQQMLRACIDEFWLVRGGLVSNFDGDLDTYENLLSEPDDVAVSPPRRKSKKIQRKQRAEAREQERQQNKQRTSVEHEIDLLQRASDELVGRLSDPNSVQQSSNADVQAMVREHGKIRKRLEHLEKEWIELVERESKITDANVD